MGFYSQWYAGNICSQKSITAVPVLLLRRQAREHVKAHTLSHVLVSMPPSLGNVEYFRDCVKLF